MSTGDEALSSSRPAAASRPTPGRQANHSLRLPHHPVGLVASGAGMPQLLAHPKWLFLQQWKGPGSVCRGHPRTRRAGDQKAPCCWAPLNISYIREFFKCRSFRINVNLNDYQFKTSESSYRSTYMNSVVTTSQKSTTHTQKPERKEYNHTTKENQPKGKKLKAERKSYKNNQKTRNKWQ